ncbi:homeobox and leucine zipper encoding a [Periophthalmus magnuspinnatus]|uniref:Homeobox domain-containing protein n=1 Tax=Periophthalmus magnuspinnatus TaxID=409849 RepID=A0A3B4B5C8_9GOBI|nr:homeobox and leucine zipper encoding a [Periophthalmus magnuspinnatus]
MELYSEIKDNAAQPVDLKSPLKTKGMGCNFEGNDKAKRDSHNKSSCEKNTMASFTTNTNSVVCLPLVSEGLKLVWTQSDQTSELDSIPELVQAFNLFPYPSSHEVNVLAKVCVLPLDKVKVWFMVQRIKYGISWSSEEIEETRRKLSVPELYESSSTHERELEMTNKEKNYNDTVDVEDTVEESSLLATPKKKSRCESPDSYKPAKHTAPCFSSSLPPPQDSYYYRLPADKQEPQSDSTLNIIETHSQQNRHSRYRKSKSQLAALRKSFLRENWPSEGELRRLQEETGLSRNDIRKWFSDSRYQLRVGRGSLAAAQGFSHNSAAGLKSDKITQNLQFVSQKHHEATDGNDHEEPQSNSDFFQNFLSHSLESFRDRPEVYDSEELSRDSEDCIKDEQEQPLQLTKQCKTETDVLQEPSNLKSSPKSPASGSPLPTFSPVKRLSNGITTSKKSVHSTKASPSQTLMNVSMAATSPSLTPAGRPRKTKEQLDMLKQYFLRCQWPKSEDYTELVKLTGLPRADVIQWFGDTRYAVKNGQLRWVKGVRDQLLAEISSQQNVVNNGSSPRIGGSRKQKSVSPDIQPLVTYYHTTGLLQEKDLDSLCKKSKMSYQQVRDWFAAQDSLDQTVAMDTN